MNAQPLESDWKTFRKITPELRERYLGKKNPALMAILQDEALTPTERFWNVEELVGKEIKILRECLDGHKRSGMVMFMMLMYGYEMLEDEDLMAFSAELRERIQKLSAD